MGKKRLAAALVLALAVTLGACARKQSTAKRAARTAESTRQRRKSSPFSQSIRSGMRLPWRALRRESAISIL